MGFKTDYKDDIINATSNEKRQYEMIQNDNGTVSFNDVTVYEQVGDTLGAKELNEISEKLNISGERIRYNNVTDMVQILNDDGLWEDWSSGVSATALIKNGVIISEYSSYEVQISTSDNFLCVNAPSSGSNYISFSFDFKNYAGKYIKIVAKSDSPGANIIITTSGMEPIYFNLAETEKSLYFPVTKFMQENGFVQLSFSIGSNTYIKTIEITASDGTEGGGGSDDVELTQAEYDALPDTKLTDNKNYFIKDATENNGNLIRNGKSYTGGGVDIESEVIDIRLKADGTTATSAGNAVREQITELKSDLADLGFTRVNHFNKNSSEILIDKYCQDNNGNVEGENIFTSTFKNGTGYLITNVIKVNEGDVVRCNGDFYGRNGVYADSDGTITGRLSSTSTDFASGYTVPADVSYLRIIVTYNTTSVEDVKNSLMITLNREMPSTYYEYEMLENDNLLIYGKQIPDIQDYTKGNSGTISDNQWSGRVACSLGTSLSQMGGWDNIVKSAFGFSKFYNRGVGSTTMADFSAYGIDSYKSTVYINNDTTAWDETQSSVFSDSAKTGYSSANAYYCGDDRINTLPSNADLVLIDLATNDAYNAIQNSMSVDWNTFMGEQSIPNYWNSMTINTSTFEGAFYSMIKKVQTRCPNARIVAWGMLVNNLFTTQNDYLSKYMTMYDKIQNLCRKNGVVFVDTMMYEGANWFNFKNEYHTDSVHPATTDVAIRGVANAIIGTLKNVYPKNYLLN